MPSSGRRTFTVFRNESGAIYVVKNGFSWPAFVFNFYWALSKRLWWLAVTIFAVAFAGLLGFSAVVHSNPGLACFVAIALELFGLTFIGLRANRWWSTALERRAFKPSETIEAANHAAAVQVASAA